MRVCVINSIFPPYARGGAEVVVFATARAFAEAGHEVFVITCAPFVGWRSFAGAWGGTTRIATDREQDSRGSRICKSCDPAVGEWPSRLSSVAIRVFRFTPLNLFTIFNISKYSLLLRIFWHVLDMFNPHTYLVVRRILQQEKPDLVITRNLKGLGYTVPLAIRHYQKTEERRKKKDTVLQFRPPSSVLRPPARWLHGLHDLGALHPRGFMEWGGERAVRNPNPAVRLYRVICRKLFGSPEVVVAPSQFVLDEYERARFFPKAKKVVVRNPVPPLNPPLVKGGNGGVMRFLYVGQLEPYKGLRVLLKAWRQFVAIHSNARLEIVGTGSMEEEARRAAAIIPSIVVRGFVAHEELPDLHIGATATVMPSLAYETFGMSAAESIAYGVPVIASAIGALPEIVEDGVSGILVPPGSALAIKEAMERIGAMPPLLSHSTFFSPAQYREELEKLYAAC